MHLSTAHPTARTRRVTAAVGAGLVASTLAACGAGASSDAATPATTVSPASSAAAFPVTVSSALGDAVIPAAPERVVALGWGAADIVLALGVVPVGIEADTWGGDADGFEPWFRDTVEAQGAALPATITMYPEIDIEAIIALEPDVIIAPQSGIDQATFDKLSEFAPVVAHPGVAWQTSPEDQVRIAAKALGVPDKAQGLIDDTDAALAAARDAHPELAGKTFAYVWGGTPGSLDVYLEGDSRVALLTDLGLMLAPSVADLAPATGSIGTSPLGLENADRLADVDVLFTWFNDEAEQQATEAQPLWAQIPAVQRGSYVPMIDRQLGMAVSVASPLSIPWALDAYVPQIAAAIAQVPAA
ncbi:iron-siderophore ABC transporter substrate-binding protein [Cellulomonas sp. WB94]|uniref:iron-siderophore ABC transporter substrate-binding protein n=1 Tax=Cellulomonas sp. WB94 TaxID=2173174 RepID=UPI000D576D6D|nr:iron-siderophore ABC transporter substrate-binding protein [Cellulomonas sp. WB94]PVU82740.1 iron-siderophore ABC transporter substrate-binding protein [Cellulomonas sp. WB94]